MNEDKLNEAFAKANAERTDGLIDALKAVILDGYGMQLDEFVDTYPVRKISFFIKQSVLNYVSYKKRAEELYEQHLLF